MALSVYLALVAGIVGLGLSGLFVRWANAPGLVTSVYRMAVAVALLAIPLARSPRSRAAFRAPGLRFALLGGVFFAADLALWATGVMLTGATTPTLLANTAPLWVGLGAVVILRERLAAGFWVGVALALAGAAAVLGWDAARAPSAGLGSLLGLLAGFFYGGYFLFAQRGRQTMDALGYFWWSGLSATVALLGAALALRMPLTGYPPVTYLAFLGTGVLSQAMGYLAISYALGHAPASLVAPTLLGQPVVTALLAWPLLGERLLPGQIAGGLAVLAGIYLVHRTRVEARL